MIEVIPAIPPESFEDLEQRMALVREHVSRVQVDIANGTYAPSRTWPFLSAQAGSSDEHFADLVKEEEGLPFWRELDVELDMLISEPENYLDDWIHVGISGAIIHIESTEKHKEIFEKLKNSQIEIGWGMKPNTENKTLFDIVEQYGMPDFVQLMGNDRVGYSGQELDERVYEKARAIKKQYPKLTLAVDIGVNDETAPLLVEAGVTKLATTTAVFESGDIEEAIEYFQNLL